MRLRGDTIDGDDEQARALPEEDEDDPEHDTSCRRVIRSQFLKLKTLINEKRDDLINTDSDKFETILDQFHKLHEQVKKPREQVADAEALLDFTRTLVGSVKSLVNEGITPSHFVSSLLKYYHQPSFNWQKLGLAVSPFFPTVVNGSSTMLGPMENQLKQRKVPARGKRNAGPTTTARPQQLDEATLGDEKTDTDKNMATMFNVLRKMKLVPLENLILNRTSFAQTVENLFALSFLVKDGRAEIKMDESHAHYVSPKNAPTANSVMSKEVTYTHFMFRYDYRDWKLMKDIVPEGKELMPHRIQVCTEDAQEEMGGGDHSQAALAVSPIRAITPIRKLNRNRGRVVQEESIVQESPECDKENDPGAAAIRRCKRKIHPE
ncbi:non-structural maintenance of chromosomes element 4 homolog A-like [Lotus japonicus]|uniref:non-structural maintenance of chromosomes element 4 homolog A-like n=1 Tax=Lotus japonicus TaxID=34305 RepID=UPI00258FE46C|nr:non-structural maintenance of chromosomes element 4 homolog A-like [Lotus japonicus]